MEDGIKPALTADEWAHRAWEVTALTLREPAELRADMALHNAALPDDHPGKITQSDVGLIRDLAGACGCNLDDDVLALTAKLAALLRPEGA